MGFYSLYYMIQNALDAIATTHNSKNEKNNELGKVISKSSFIEIIMWHYLWKSLFFIFTNYFNCSDL